MEGVRDRYMAHGCCPRQFLRHIFATQRVATFSALLVPIMAGIYLLIALITIALHIDQVPAMFAPILHDAFSPQAAVGGGIGTAILTVSSPALRTFERGG